MRVDLTLAHARVRLHGELSTQRRALGRQSLRAFGRLYLGHCFPHPDSRLHTDLYALLQDTPEQRGQRLAIAAPRGSAKSTVVSLAYILWCLCYGTERYIVLLSDTADKARDFLSHVKAELEGNPLLREDFPEVSEPLDRKPPPNRWRRDEIITRTNVKVTALGAGQKLRGRKHRSFRPSLLLLDDVENEDNTHTPEARERLRSWFTKVVLKSGTAETNVIVIGTIQHYDALLARLVDLEHSPDWSGRVYRSVITWSAATEHWTRWTNLFNHRDTWKGRSGPDAATWYLRRHWVAMIEGTEVLWPEVEPYAALMKTRESEGHASFDAEKQNQPINPQECLFPEDELVFWDDQWPTEDALLSSFDTSYHMFGACDPSLGRHGRHGDDSAIVTILRDKATGILYVLDADIARRSPDRTINDILAYRQRRDYRDFAIETNHFQQLMADELQRRSREEGVYIPIAEVRHATDKVGRIQSLQPLAKSGTLRFSRRHRALLEQLRYFPKAAHDDGPDALEMAVSLAKEGGRRQARVLELRR